MALRRLSRDDLAIDCSPFKVNPKPRQDAFVQLSSDRNSLDHDLGERRRIDSSVSSKSSTNAATLLAARPPHGEA
jgi:hypothetical protein